MIIEERFQLHTDPLRHPRHLLPLRLRTLVYLCEKDVWSERDVKVFDRLINAWREDRFDYTFEELEETGHPGLFDDLIEMRTDYQKILDIEQKEFERREEVRISEEYERLTAATRAIADEASAAATKKYKAKSWQTKMIKKILDEHPDYRRMEAELRANPRFRREWRW